MNNLQYMHIVELCKKGKAIIWVTDKDKNVYEVRCINGKIVELKRDNSIIKMSFEDFYERLKDEYTISAFIIL